MSLGIVEVGGDSYNGIGYFLSNEGFGDFLHFCEDHGRDFFWSVGFHFVSDFSLDVGFSIFVDDFVREIVFVRLDSFVGKFTAD